MNARNQHLTKARNKEENVKRKLRYGKSRFQKVTMTMEEAALFLSNHPAHFYICPICGYIHAASLDHTGAK